jgi:subtilisin family serine protease
VSAAGNDGCDCLHVPAALSSVLAVGAMDSQGKPSDFSNWGTAYQSKGLLAPGENILGAKPGGGTDRLNGTSFAAPIVSGVAALLLSLQVQRGKPPDPHGIRKLLLQTATPCDP